jgi:hypothetical protein
MAYTKVKLSSLVTKQIQSWALPDQIQAELFLYLTRILPADPEHNLSRVGSPFDGLVAECARADPFVRGREHAFAFLVYIGQDEQTLHVARGDYRVSEPGR